MRVPTASIFNSALTKLTLTYAGLLSLISLGFSLSFYQVSVRGLNSNFIVQTQILDRRPGFSDLVDRQDFQTARRAALDSAISELTSRLVITNIIVLGSSVLISYAFAKQSLRPIEEAHEAQVRFSADASHELKTPLAAMQTEIDVNLRSKNLTLKDAKAVLESNREEVGNMTRIVGMLLSLASNDEKLDIKKPVEIQMIVKEALESVKSPATKAQVKMHNDAKSKLVIKGDGDSLKEALVILLDNAIKYSPVNSEITIKSHKRMNCVEIEVVDQGPGIAKEMHEKIFERFYRGDSSHTKSNQNGYGLGLALAKQIVETHSGYIKVQSKPGKGSSFTISLPT